MRLWEYNISKFSGGACSQTPLEGKAFRALLTGALGAEIVTVKIPPEGRGKSRNVTL